MESSNLQLPLSISQQFYHLNWYCAVSGGADSMALMHLLKKQFPKKSITIFSIDHQWSSQSNQWIKFVQEQAKLLEMTFLSFRVPCEKKSESYAREQRIRVYRDILKDSGVIFLAHHLDDQIETSLWRWMRGNWDNLHGMEFAAPFNSGFLVRPLLNYSKELIRSYVKDNNILFVEDPSNQDLEYTRNFLRHDVISKIKEFSDDFVDMFVAAQKRYQHRYRQINKIINSSAVDSNILNLESIKSDSPFFMKLSLEHWLKNLDIPYPSTEALDEFIRQCFESKSDRHPQLFFGKYYVLSFYQNKVFLNTKADLVIDNQKKKNIMTREFSWNNTSYCFSKKELSKGQWIVFQGSKRYKVYCELYPDGVRLSELWKNLGVAPFMRSRYPVIEYNGQFVQLGGLCLCPEFREKGEYFIHVKK